MHDCKLFIAEFGHCKPCEDARPKREPSPTESFLKQLEQNALLDLQTSVDRQIIRDLGWAYRLQRPSVDDQSALIAKVRSMSSSRHLRPIYEIGSREVFYELGRTTNTYTVDLYGPGGWEGECILSI